MTVELLCKTIEIDDSGTGDLVGDAFIGFHIKETGKIIFRGIPVGLYNTIEKRKDKLPEKRILEVVKDGLKALKFNKSKDVVQICRGSCFNFVREWFDQEGINHKPAIVEGKLQDAVEGRLISHLKKLGINSPRLSTEAGATRYFVLFNWVCRDFYEREKFVKTGFPSWSKKWRQIGISKYRNFRRSRK